MKKLILPLLLISVAMFSACNNSKKGSADTREAQQVTVAADVESTLSVDASQSYVKWIGSKIVGGGHHGVVNIKSGEVELSGQTVVGGSVIVDMRSISSEDLTGEAKGKLEGHLKSGDFFDVENYPEARFEATSIQQDSDSLYTVSGNLTIRDITKNISVKAILSESGQGYSVTVPSFSIDRTEWNIVYGSSKLTDKAKDAVIKDEIELEVYLVVKK